MGRTIHYVAYGVGTMITLLPAQIISFGFGLSQLRVTGYVTPLAGPSVIEASMSGPGGKGPVAE
jgi:hypothetical protein